MEWAGGDLCHSLRGRGGGCWGELVDGRIAGGSAVSAPESSLLDWVGVSGILIYTGDYGISAFSGRRRNYLEL